MPSRRRTTISRARSAASLPPGARRGIRSPPWSRWRGGRNGDRVDGVRFAVDRMLGRLARWLRVLGHDVAYGSHLGGRTLLDCARREGRLLLTRDTRLVRGHD